jgi:hypothetical protein
VESRPHRWPWPWTRLLPLCALAALVYAGAVPSGFVLDDHFAVVSNPVVTGEVSALKAFTRDFWGRAPPNTIGTYRPLAVLSFVLDARLGGGAAWWFHLTNVGLHVLAVAALYLVWRRQAGEATAWPAAALFCMLAAPSEAVHSLVGRADILGALFGLLGYAAHRTAGPRGAWAAWLCFALALASKESSLLYPLLWCLLEVLRTGVWRTLPWGRLGGYAALGALYLGARWNAVGTLLSARIGDMTNPLVTAPWPQRVLGAADIFWNHYLGGIANPMQRLYLCSAPACGPVGVESPGAWLGLAALGLLAALAVGLWRREPVVSAGLAWFLLLFLPVSNLLVLSPSVYGERLLYGPLMGASLALAHGVSRLAARLPRPAIAWGLLGVVAAGNALALQWRHGDWRDDATLALSALEVEPDSAVVQANAADSWLRLGRPAEAEARARKAIELDAGYAKPYGLLAGALDMQERPGEAEPAFEKALALSRTEEALLNLARFHANRGRPQRALELLENERLAQPPGPERLSMIQELRQQVADTRP